MSSREVEAAARGPDGQFRAELAIGGWPPSSSAFASPSLKVAPEAAADDGGFAAGQSALLLGLSSRTELVGQLVTLRSFDATSARWAVTVASSGESIKVRSQCLQPSIFR